jgi:hypothetical protein
MKTSLFAAVSAAALLLAASGAASGQTISATITADNHYAFYVSDDNGNFTYIGGNELGSGGSPGNYNWSLPEVWNIASAPTHLYIAAWSDNRSAQGLLAQISFGDETYHSGDAAWRVYHSFNDLGDGSAHPTAGTVANWVSLADTGNAWETPFVGGQNGSYGPWGMVPGITTDARWMWAGNPGLNDPMLTGLGYGETLVFGIAIPTPGAAAVIGLGGLLAFRRRR